MQYPFRMSPITPTNGHGGRPKEIMDFILNYSDAIDCRIMTPEAFQYRKEFYTEILNNKDALSKVDIFGTHFYRHAEKGYELPAVRAEGRGQGALDDRGLRSEQLGPTPDTWPEAVEVAVDVPDAMTEGNMQAYVWWYIRRF